MFVKRCDELVVGVVRMRSKKAKTPHFSLIMGGTYLKVHLHFPWTPVQGVLAVSRVSYHDPLTWLVSQIVMCFGCWVKLYST